MAKDFCGDERVPIIPDLIPGYKVYALNMSSDETPFECVTEIELFDGKGKARVYRVVPRE